MAFIKYITDGQKIFSFPFSVYSANDVRVFINDLLISQGNYLVEIFAEGGEVSFNKTPEKGDIITVDRVLEIERKTSFQQYKNISADDLNKDLDFLFMAINDIKEVLDRTFRINNFEDTIDPIESGEDAVLEIKNNQPSRRSTDDFEKVVCDFKTTIRKIQQDVDDLTSSQSVHMVIGLFNNLVKIVKEALPNIIDDLGNIDEEAIETTDYGSLTDI
ncbi:MAG: hypothetical protein JJV93_02715 [Alphaproteobacteria bacterium]|nr:hypothetical protein [Alphaproteobacteria bacterium]MBL0718141.1 hypothetical protein [Alphaproteobacteria bacterium]